MIKEKEKLDHNKLIDIGRKWLMAKSPVVFTEIKSCNEEPDILGLEASIKHKNKCVGYGSVLIECKTSRSDFKADSKKVFRRIPDMGIGQYRFYLTKKGLITLDELPEKWGLLETSGKTVKVIKFPERFPVFNTKNEMRIVTSALRRLNIESQGHCSIRAYTYKTKNTASITIEQYNKEVD